MIKLDWIIKKEEHMRRFFGTKWNSKISIKRWHKSYGERGLYFREGYVEFRFNHWVIRYRNQK